MEKLKQNYTSPRWSMEIPDCSMPMSMDTYSRCSYNCLYCFSFFQKSHTTKGYLTGQPRSVNPEKVIALFENAAVNNTAAANKTDVQFFKYIQDRRIMQWGGLADEFDEYERRNGVTLELLRYFDKIDYDTTMAQWLRSNWNDTKKGTSPARAYGGVLVPDGKDENGDVIYRYAIKR